MKLQVTRPESPPVPTLCSSIHNKAATVLEGLSLSFLFGKHAVLRMHAAMCRKAQRLTYPLLADESGDLRKAFGIEPMTRVVSQHACIHAGDSVCVAEC